MRSHNRLLTTWRRSAPAAASAPNAPDGNDDAAYGTAPDLGPLCTGNNDGKIDRSELAVSRSAPASTTWQPERHDGRRSHPTARK